MKRALALVLLLAATCLPAAAQEKPNPALQKLSPLVGEWTVQGKMELATEVKGKITYEYLPGNFFFVSKSDIDMGGAKLQGMEVVGWNEQQKALQSLGFGNLSSQVGTFKWDLNGDALSITSGGLSFQGKLSKDKKSLKGKWEWMEAGAKKGYEVTYTKVK